MKIRPMTMADADKMLEWKNYKETRQFAIISKDEIKKEDHYKWLQANIEDFDVILDNGNIVGAMRIKDYEVSIWIDREFWNKGIATYTLQHNCKRGMTAKIVCGNVPSMKAFIRAGFEPVSFHETYYTFKKW